MHTEKKLEIKWLQSGGLITNYFCSSVCRHCLYRCSPKWPKDFISDDYARRAFALCRRLGCLSMHIGGGEPLLRPDRIEAIVSLARECGIHIDYVETNSSWFRTHDEACRLLERLAEKGLSTLLVSISPFHVEHIPLAKVKGVIRACKEVGIRVFPWIMDFLGELDLLDDSVKHKIEEYEAILGPGYLEKIPTRYWISPGGRALDTFDRFQRKVPWHELVRSHDGCKELADTSHFHMDLYGNYIPGLCAGLSIKWKDLDSPLDKGEYPVISRLFSEGIGALFDYAAPKGFTPSETGYASKCSLCYAIRRFLVVDKGINSKELQPVGHYLHG